MKLFAQADKKLLFNRLRFTGFFVAGLFVSFGVPLLEELVDVAPHYLVPMRLLIFPLFFAALFAFVPRFKRDGGKVSVATLWFNAMYVVGLGLAVLWILQIAVLLFGAGDLMQVNLAASLKMNIAMLFWAVFAVGFFRLLLGRMAVIFEDEVPASGWLK